MIYNAARGAGALAGINELVWFMAMTNMNLLVVSEKGVLANLVADRDTAYRPGW